MSKYIMAIVLGLCVTAWAEKPQKKVDAAASAAARPAADARSFIELFTKLEANTMTAIQQRDSIALDAMLAPEFIVRNPEDSADPVSRGIWMKAALTRWDVRSFSQSAMVIRAFATEAVVSYVQTQQASFDGKDRGGKYLVVDLWVVNHGTWQLAARNIGSAIPRPGSN
jgi:hypothetical protein